MPPSDLFASPRSGASSPLTPQAARLLDLPLPPETRALLSAAPSVILAGSHQELITLAVRDARADGIHEVDYQVPGVYQQLLDLPFLEPDD